jgi:Glycosyl transferase family 2
MRIIGTCMVSNESDIIEAFVRHNSGYLDALVVLDHVSTDATPSILASLVKEGLPLTVLHDGDRAFRQGERMTEMARSYLGSLDADYCFAMDADELIKVASRGDLERSLEAIPAGAAGVIPVQNYVGNNASVDANPVRRLTRRMRVERQQPHKAVVRRSFAAGDHEHISLGNHAVMRVDEGVSAPIRHVLMQGLSLAHFPVRSAEQIARKVLLGWLAHRLAMPGDATLVGHWRGVFEGLSSGSMLIDEKLCRRAIALYIGSADGIAREAQDAELMEDPLAVPYELRYTSLLAPNAMAALASWADQLVSEIKSGATVA